MADKYQPNPEMHGSLPLGSYQKRAILHVLRPGNRVLGYDCFVVHCQGVLPDYKAQDLVELPHAFAFSALTEEDLNLPHRFLASVHVDCFSVTQQ